MIRYIIQNADNKQSQYHGKTAVIVADSYPELTKKAEKMGWCNWLVIKTENACDTVEYPKVKYDHLPCALTDGQHYIGQNESLINKELSEYLAECWPLKYDSYHCKGYSVHQKINNGHYIRAAIRYYKERYRLRNDKLYLFRSAHDNLTVFDSTGKYVPIEKQKYERR